MALVFINYRSRDVGWPAGMIYERLVERFGPRQVYYDTRAMSPGDFYPDHIRGAVERAGVLIAVIGRDWLTIADEHGRLLDRERDWVRYEIARALARRIRVVPVLLDNTPRLQIADLPPDIADLARLEAYRIYRPSHVADIYRLADALARDVPGLRTVRTRRLRVALTAAALVPVLAGGLLAATTLRSRDAGTTAAPPAGTAPHTTPAGPSGPGTPTGPTTPPTSRSPAGPPSGSEPPGGTVRLTSLPIADGAENVSPERTATLGDHTYQDSLQFDCQYAGEISVHFKLGGRYRRLTGWFGILDVSGATDGGSLAIEGGPDGLEFKNAGPGGQPVRIDVSVAGTDDLRVGVFCPATGVARGVFADPVLTTAAG